MKTKILPLLLAICGLCILPNAAAFEPPTDSQLEKAMANPDDALPALLKGATGEQAADIVERLIAMIQESKKLTELQKEYNVSYLVAKVTRMLAGDQRNSFAKALLGKELGDVREIVIAALSVGATGSDAFKQVLVELIGDNAKELTVLNAPKPVFSGSVFSQLIASLGLAPGISAGTLPPPVAIPYQGQRPF